MMRRVLVGLLAAMWPAAAVAQNGIYIQAGPAVDVRFLPSTARVTDADDQSDTYSWLDLNNDRRWQPGEELALPRSEAPKRYAPGFSIAVGSFISPRVSFRLDAARHQAYVTTTEVGRAGGPIYVHGRQTTTSTDATVVAGWHKPIGRKIAVTYLGGVVFRRQDHERSVAISGPSLTVIQQAQLTSVLRTTGVLPEYDYATFSTGIVGGLEAEIGLTKRIALVPHIRLISAENAWNVQPGIAVRWRP